MPMGTSLMHNGIEHGSEHHSNKNKIIQQKLSVWSFFGVTLIDGAFAMRAEL